MDQVFLDINFLISGKKVYFILYAYYAWKENLTRFNKNYVALLIIMCICHNYIFHNYIFSVKTIITAWIPSNNNKYLSPEL